MKLIKGKRYVCIKKYIIEKSDIWERAINPCAILYCTSEGVLACDGAVIVPEKPEEYFEEWNEAPDWQAIRNQAAIAAMKALISATDKNGQPVEWWKGHGTAECAVSFADALVEELQKKKSND